MLGFFPKTVILGGPKFVQDWLLIRGFWEPNFGGRDFGPDFFENFTPEKLARFWTGFSKKGKKTPKKGVILGVLKRCFWAEHGKYKGKRCFFPVHVFEQKKSEKIEKKCSSLKHIAVFLF